jgi:DNA-binding SARP family transcriptional activator
MLRLKLLGTPAVDLSGPAPGREVLRRKPLAVLALLAAADESGLSRDKLFALLWPEASHAKAAHALNQLLHVLRRDLGMDALFQGSSDLRLNPEHITSDLADFREAWSRGDLQRAVTLYGGPFLDGFFLRGAPEFEHWVESERAKLARAYSEALGSLAAEAAARGDHRRAAEWWRRLADEAPLSSGVTMQLMSSLAAAGDRAAALKQADVYQRLIREELEAAPNQAVMALAARLRSAEDSSSTQPSKRPLRLAVSPFANLSTVRRNKQFAEGLTAEVTNALCGLEGLRVIAAPPTNATAVSLLDAKDASLERAVDLILQGVVRQEAEQVRLTVQLIDVSSRRYLWSGQYQRRVEDAVSAQDELTLLIMRDLRATMLQLKLTAK